MTRWHVQDAVNVQKIDLDLECNGHLVAQLAPVTHTRTRMDFWRVLDARIPNAPEDRPYFVNQMMVKLFSDGIYLWWMKYDSQQTALFGHPYNLGNPAR